jgi:hypothetical protein
MNTLGLEMPGSVLRGATRVRLVCLLFLFALTSELSGFGQGLTGSIAGTVTDASGATISGATVTVVQVDTNAIHTATTSNVGSYRVPELSPGTYRVKVEKAGFQVSQQDKITLAIDQVRRSIPGSSSAQSSRPFPCRTKLLSSKLRLPPWAWSSIARPSRTRP